MSKFILLTEHAGPSERFDYVTYLEVSTWEDAREVSNDLLADREHWEDNLCINTPLRAEILEITKSEEIKIPNED